MYVALWVGLYIFVSRNVIGFLIVGDDLLPATDELNGVLIVFIISIFRNSFSSIFTTIFTVMLIYFIFIVVTAFSLVTTNVQLLFLFTFI